MPNPSHMNVKLLDVTNNAQAVIYAACRQCYSDKFAGDLFESGDKERQADFVRRVVSAGHESPLEHVKFTFAIEGVSRTLTHQLVRHRVASYSQQSQRYVKENNFDYIIPAALESEAPLKKEFEELMEKIQSSYNKILNYFKEKGASGEEVNQDARYVLPGAAETKIVATMNCRELIHFFNQRCCTRAQWEIRELAERMLEICRQSLPEVFSATGAKCVGLGYCPEGSKFSCGRYPLKEEVINVGSA